MNWIYYATFPKEAEHRFETKNIFYFCKNDDSRNARLTESITIGSPAGYQWSPSGATREQKYPQNFKSQWHISTIFQNLQKKLTSQGYHTSKPIILGSCRISGWSSLRIRPKTTSSFKPTESRFGNEGISKQVPFWFMSRIKPQWWSLNPRPQPKNMHTNTL